MLKSLGRLVTNPVLSTNLRVQGSFSQRAAASIQIQESSFYTIQQEACTHKSDPCLAAGCLDDLQKVLRGSSTGRRVANFVFNIFHRLCTAQRLLSVKCDFDFLHWETVHITFGSSEIYIERTFYIENRHSRHRRRRRQCNL